MAITLPSCAPQFSYTELLCVLRHMRTQRDLLQRRVLLMEERLRDGHNGDHAISHQRMVTELDLMDGAIRSMWREVLKPL